MPIARGKRRYVEMFAVLDHINGRLDELRGVILSQSVPEPERAEARKRRDFLLGQERVVRGGGGWKSRLRRLDPELVEEILREGKRGPPAPRGPAAPEHDRPSYWVACEGMAFGELQRFIDRNLLDLRDGGGGPRSEEDFLDLLGLLRAKDGAKPPAAAGEAPGPRGESGGGFVPSEDLRALREECVRLREEAARYRRGGSAERMARFQERRAERCRERADAWEAEERREHDDRRRERLSGRGEAPTPAALPQDLSGTVRRIEGDIERAFGPGGPLGPPADLPWELLPPGQLTREGVLDHYERLARAHPERGYLPERILKALSLGPVRWSKGRKGFRGYVVFEYPGTERVLLECPMCANAIYVLGGHWRRLSRESKGAVLGDDATERIPHAGDWSGRTKRALGIQ